MSEKSRTSHTPSQMTRGEILQYSKAPAAADQYRGRRGKGLASQLLDLVGCLADGELSWRMDINEKK